MRMPLLSAVAFAACAGAAHPGTAPMSAGAHLAQANQDESEAQRHEAQAAQSRADQPGPGVACGDTVLADQATTGGEPLGVQPTCASGDLSARHIAEADQLHDDARAQRAAANDLRAAEALACRGLDAAALAHSPFARRARIATVVGLHDGPRLVGASIRFRRAAPLNPVTLRHQLACHQARAAVLGFDPRYLSDDPTVVDGATSTVIDDGRGIEVEVRAARDDQALIVYARAAALIARR